VWQPAVIFGLVKIVTVLMRDALLRAVLLCCPPEAIPAENLFLRRQLALLLERCVQPRPCRRCDPRQLDAAVAPLRLAGRAGRREASDAAALATRGAQVGLTADELRALHALSGLPAAYLGWMFERQGEYRSNQLLEARRT
jgi:hypothetical protein